MFFIPWKLHQSYKFWYSSPSRSTVTLRSSNMAWKKNTFAYIYYFPSQKTSVSVVVVPAIFDDTVGIRSVYHMLSCSNHIAYFSHHGSYLPSPPIWLVKVSFRDLKNLNHLPIFAEGIACGAAICRPRSARISMCVCVRSGPNRRKGGRRPWMLGLVSVTKIEALVIGKGRYPMENHYVYWVCPL